MDWSWLQVFSDWFTRLVLLLGAAHLFVFVILGLAMRRDWRRLAVFLGDILRGIPGTSAEEGESLDDRTAKFLQDLGDLLGEKSRERDRAVLARRLVTKDESKPYLGGGRLEWWHNFARTGVEAYPLLGILGTIWAIAVGMGAQSAAPKATGGAAPARAEAPAIPNAPDTAEAGEATMDRSESPTLAIMENFRMAIGSTLAGLSCGILLLMVSACLDPGMARLLEHRQSVRDTIRRARLELASFITGATQPIKAPGETEGSPPES